MSRLPELEHELVAAAGRLVRRRRFAGRVPALAAATAATLACVLGLVLLTGPVLHHEDAARRGGAPAAKPGPVHASVKLEDLFAIFRRPQRASDDMGISKSQMDEIPDRQPGEDFTESRRVEWPGVRIFMWPKRDGVCYGVRGGSGCTPLEFLRRRGVAPIYGSQQGRFTVAGAVVDGIREVVITERGRRVLRVPVRENFFFVDLNAAGARLGAPGLEKTVTSLRWRYGGKVRSYDLTGMLPHPPAPPDKPASRVLPGSMSVPLVFTIRGTRFSAVGYHAADETVCVRLFTAGESRPSVACLRARLIRKYLRPVNLFAAGGGRHGIVRTGFTRADVVGVEPVERADDITVALSRAWRPKPWRGDPIRFLLMFDRARQAGGSPATAGVTLRVRFANGRTALISRD